MSLIHNIQDIYLFWEKGIEEAIKEAELGASEGGLPIGSVLMNSKGDIVSRGHNLRVQSGDPTAHAEVVCIRNAGRRHDWQSLTLVSTLSPCIMCTGTSLLYKIPIIIIGENINFKGAEDLFIEHDIKIAILNNQHCINLMSDFIRQNETLWNEDIGMTID